jgi:hypothetical protein
MASVEAWDEEDWPELEELDDEVLDEEVPPCGMGSIDVTCPGVVAPVGRTIDTSSPGVMVGRFGVSGTITVRVMVVICKGMSPDVALSPRITWAAPTSTLDGRN